MEEAFRSLLSAGLSGVPAGRINWGQHPQDGGRAYIVLTVISLIEGMTQQGPDGLEQYRVQVDCYAPEFLTARNMGRDVKSLLGGHRGGGFRLIQFAGMRHLRESGEATGDALYRASLDFMTYWRNDHAG